MSYFRGGSRSRPALTPPLVTISCKGVGEYAVSPSGTAAPGQTQVYRVLAPDMAPELIVHAFYCFPRPHVPLVVSTRCTDVCGSPSVSRVTVNSRKQGGQGLTVIADCTELRPSPPPRISCARWLSRSCQQRTGNSRPHCHHARRLSLQSSL